MGSKKKKSKKNTEYNLSETNQPKDKKAQGKTTVLGISPRELGAVVAAAVLAEVSQLAINKMSKSIAQSNPKEQLQSQLGPINSSVKNILGEVKDAIADAALPSSEALDVVEDTLTKGRAAAGDGFAQSVNAVKKATAVTAGIAQDQVDDLLDDSKQKLDQTREFVVAQITHAIAGAEGAATGARHAVDDTVEAFQDTASTTQEAIAAVIDEAVGQVKLILANARSASSYENSKTGKQGKKNKKHRKGK